MDNFGFATFNPISPSLNSKQEEARKYYEDNNLQPDNDFMANFLGISEKPAPIQISTPKTSTTPQRIGDVLGSMTYKSTAPADVNFTVPHISSNATVNQKAKQGINFFMSKGLTKQQAAGIMGNLHAESGLDPNVKPGDNGTAHGIAQWRLDRYSNLQNFAKQANKPLTDYNTQLEFVWHELSGKYSGALQKLKETSTIVDAARIFSKHYENPAQYETKREAAASQFFNLK